MRPTVLPEIDDQRIRVIKDGLVWVWYHRCSRIEYAVRVSEPRSTQAEAFASALTHWGVHR